MSVLIHSIVLYLQMALTCPREPKMTLLLRLVHRRDESSHSVWRGAQPHDRDDEAGRLGQRPGRAVPSGQDGGIRVVASRTHAAHRQRAGLQSVGVGVDAVESIAQ